MRRWACFVACLVLVVHGERSQALSWTEASPPKVAASTESSLNDVAQSPTWLRLIHYSRARGPGEVVSDDFYLSPNGRTDPLAELKATIAAYQTPWSIDGDVHPRCRYPARYFWLSQQVFLPAYSVRDPRCRRLEKWADLDRTQSASLLLVSGYFGNPASSFGHALLRLKKSGDSATELLDITINYGALVPPRESTVLYVARGLFGGYRAGFSDKHFYTEDLVYARTELRDIWEYELELDQKQLQLLIFHLWEVIGKKFDYYFLTKNCAYRLAELLELVTERSWVEASRLWYLPVEPFHRMARLAMERSGGPSERRRFIPSAQRQLREAFASLSFPERGFAERAIHAPTTSLESSLAGLQPKGRVAVADALVDYYQYRLTSPESEAVSFLTERKDEAVRLRLGLPVASRASGLQAASPSPADGAGPMLTGIGVAHDRTRGGYTQIRFAPFHSDEVGLNTLGGGALVVLDAAVGVDATRAAFLDHIDLVRVRKLDADSALIPGDSPWSWQARIGIGRIPSGASDRLDPYAVFGVGRSARLGSQVVTYAMVDARAQAARSLLGVEPNIGVMAEAGSWKAWVQGGMMLDAGSGGWSARFSTEARYALSKNQAIRVEYLSERETRRYVLSLFLYW
jgi:hypothetical protein